MKDTLNNKQGIITKCLGGLYTIESPDGIYECKARGVFRSRGVNLYTGDYAEFSDGVITKILDRKNSIIRPPLANLDMLIFVVSTCSPSPNLLLLDKFIAIAEYKNIEPVIVITKIDLEDCEKLERIYTGIGIKVLKADYSDKESINAVRELISGKISAFTGNSGAGKSTLLNAIDPSLEIPTGEISRKLGRGRHTTRHAELYRLAEGGYIADTPGFSTFETNKYDIIRKEELSGCFREFREYEGDCRFKDCSHTCEKGCAIIAAREEGLIYESRHSSYCQMYDEAKQIKEWELK